MKESIKFEAVDMTRGCMEVDVSIVFDKDMNSYDIIIGEDYKLRGDWDILKEVILRAVEIWGTVEALE